MTTGRYFVHPEIDALPLIELGVQIFWSTRTDKDLRSGDFGFAMQVDLFEEIDLGHWGSIMSFVSSDRGALPEAFELGIVAPLHSRARGVLCMKFGLMFANVWPFGRPEGLTHLAQSSVLRGPIRFK